MIGFDEQKVYAISGSVLNQMLILLSDNRTVVPSVLVLTLLESLKTVQPATIITKDKNESE